MLQNYTEKCYINQRCYTNVTKLCRKVLQQAKMLQKCSNNVTLTAELNRKSVTKKSVTKMLQTRLGYAQASHTHVKNNTCNMSHTHVASVQKCQDPENSVQRCSNMSGS